MIQLTGDEGVRGSLEGSQTVANDENRDTEARKALGLDAGNRDQGADGIEAEAPDKDSAVAIVSQDPGSVSDGRQRIGSVSICQYFEGVWGTFMVESNPK